MTIIIKDLKKEHLNTFEHLAVSLGACVEFVAQEECACENEPEYSFAHTTKSCCHHVNTHKQDHHGGHNSPQYRPHGRSHRYKDEDMHGFNI